MAICVDTDVGGKVRIWDTTQKEHVLKNEFQPLGGPIKDLAWSGDSQRIVVVGEGRERYIMYFYIQRMQLLIDHALNNLLYCVECITFYSHDCHCLVQVFQQGFYLMSRRINHFCP
jgi:WD40 repeat protein